MNNNDILKRVRYIFNFGDDKMIALFGLDGLEVTRAEISDWLKKEEDEAFQKCDDLRLATFLNGLIVDQRGKKEGAIMEPEKRLSNNIVFRKLKIALNLKNEEVLDVLMLADFSLGTHELSAFFRKEGHKHYRQCKDQVLRNFLKGLQLKFRDQEIDNEPDN